jgi:uncharacterized cupredoxin-like copper-binding protein
MSAHRVARLGFALALALAPAGAWAQHEHLHHESKARETAFGKPADPAKAKRTIAIDMSDAMRFTPAEVAVERGEIVRFVVTNSGKLDHEMVIGTRKELEEHAEAMRRNASMDHHDDAPNMVHVAPGGRGEIGWQFTRAGEFHFGCLVPGHFEAGMVGKVRVK